MTLKEKLENCRRAYAKGVTLIELTHPDGQKSAVRNKDAVNAAVRALGAELERQIAELG